MLDRFHVPIERPTVFHKRDVKICVQVTVYSKIKHLGFVQAVAGKVGFPILHLLHPGREQFVLNLEAQVSGGLVQIGAAVVLRVLEALVVGLVLVLQDLRASTHLLAPGEVELVDLVASETVFEGCLEIFEAA